MDEIIFDQTGTEVARQARLSPDTIRAYARTGALECRRLSNGIRVFKRDAAAKAKALAVKNMANRFRRTSAA